LTVLFSLLLVVGLTNPVHAKNDKIFVELHEDIAYINSLNEEEILYLIQNDRKFIEEIEDKLVKYLSKLSEDEKRDTMLLLHGINPFQRSSSLSAYFDTWLYHYRGVYFTFSLTPKWSVRLFNDVFWESYDALKTNYSAFQNDSNLSLYKQYYCHYLYDFTLGLSGAWDIEIGRPSIPMDQMLGCWCNPE